MQDSRTILDLWEELPIARGRYFRLPVALVRPTVNVLRIRGGAHCRGVHTCLIGRDRAGRKLTKN